MNEDYKNRGMDLKRFTLYFQKKIWIILLLILVGGMIGAISYRMIRTMKMPVEYESVSKLYITFNQDENGDVYQYYNGYTWNELLDTDPILIAIMNHLTGYEEEEVKDAASAEILSDIRLLTITVKGDSEKMVREIQAAVEEGLADVALSRHVRNLKHCKQKLLIKEPYVCVCGPSSPLAALKRPLSAKEFAENYLVMRQKGSRMRSKLEEWFKSVGVYEFLSTPVIEVNSLESSKQLIARGFGAAAFPSIAVRQELKRESLIMLSVENFSVTADYFLGYNDKRELSPAAFEFISLLTESMKPKDQI